MNTMQDTVLHRAVKALDVQRVQQLLEQGCPPNLKNTLLDTPLHVLMELRGLQQHCIPDWEHKERVVFDLLVQHGADVRCGNDVQETPLHKAAQSGKQVFLESLVCLGSPVCAQDAWKRNALEMAVKSSCPLPEKMAMVAFLFQAELKVSGTSNFAGKAFHACLKHGAKDDPEGTLVQWFLDNGVFPNSKATTELEEIETPLFLACQHHYWKACFLLLKHGADVHAQDELGNTALHFVAQSDEPETKEQIKALVQYGANVMAVNKKGETTLFTAIRTNSLSSLKALLPLYNDAQLHWQNNHGKTVLDIAPSSFMKDIVRQEFVRREQQQLKNAVSEELFPLHSTASRPRL